jgi:Protein kinase domain
MSWVNARQFKIANRNGRHYVFRRNNAGNTEINIPKTITTKAEAARWLRAHPNKVAKPNRYKGKRVGRPMAVYHAAFDPFASPRNTRQSPGYFFRYSSPRYAGVPSPAKASTPKTNLSASNFKKSLRNMVSIGSGRQGRAYVVRQGKAQFVLKVAPYDGLSKKRGEPQPGDVEYEIHSKCMKAAPNGVVKVYSHIHALDFVPNKNLKNIPNLNKPHYDLSKQNIIVMELCEGGSLDKWINSHTVTDDTMHKIIEQILGTLRKIQAKYPYFRHNDLHVENIFVSRKRGFLIADFGWARLKEKGTNPAVNTANGTTTASHYGVGPKTDARYDQHLFLNQLRDIALKTPSKFPKTIEFLNKAVPEGYRGKTDTHINDFRLKYEDPCPGLPSLYALFKMPYLRTKFVSSPQLESAKGRLRKTGRKLTPARNSSPRRAKARNYTNAELIALTRNQLFKLSPKTRNRAVRLRAAVKKSPPKKANNATARVKGGHGQIIATARAKIPNNILRDPRFTNMWVKIKAGLVPYNTETVYNVESRARNRARSIIQNRLGKGLQPFSASPRRRTPKAAPRKTPSPVRKSNASPRVHATTNVRLRRAVAGAKKSPESGRMRIKAPSGRLVYADGASVSMNYLKNFAKRHGVNLKGVRSKAAIVEKLFG